MLIIMGGGPERKYQLEPKRDIILQFKELITAIKFGYVVGVTRISPEEFLKRIQESGDSFQERREKREE